MKPPKIVDGQPSFEHECEDCKHTHQTPFKSLKDAPESEGTVTPGRWTLATVAGKPVIHRGTEWIATMEISRSPQSSEANAAWILNAVNSYRELMEALFLAREFCIDFRQNKDWKNHPEVGVLFSKLEMLTDSKRKSND